MKFSTLLFAASAALLPTSFAIEESAKKYLRSGAISAINPFDRSLGSTDDWCPGFNDQLCIKTNQPADGGFVEVHANFNVSPNGDGSYNWSVGFTEDPEVIIPLLDDTPDGDPIMLKYAIIENPLNFPDDPQYIKYGGKCLDQGNSKEHESCMIVKHQHPAGGNPSWTSEDLIASDTIPAGSTLIWWLHVNLRYGGSIDADTSFALPCADALGTVVDPDLQLVHNTDGGGAPNFLSPPFPNLTFVDPDDGTYVFDHLSQVHGWGWQFYYTAPTESCGEIPPETPDCEDPDGCVPECIPDPEVVITDPDCTTEIGILAGQHIDVGTATLKMKEDEVLRGYNYTVTVNIKATTDDGCTIEPRKPCDGDCENVKVQSGEFTKDISKLPLGKYADKCCLPQNEYSTEEDILIAEGFVSFGSDFPLSIHLDLQVNCTEVDDSGHWTDCSSETAFAMEPDDPTYVTGSCPLLGVTAKDWLDDVKHGWGQAVIINTTKPTS